MTKTLFAAALIALLTGTAAVSNTHALGGYTPAEETTITEEMQEIFDEATDKLIGVNYVPVQMIEKQIVNGTNYKFIAESTVVYPGAETKNVIVTIHQDLSGNASVLDIEVQ